MGETDKRPHSRSGVRRSTSSVLTPPTGIPSLDDLGVGLPAQRASEQVPPPGAPVTPPAAPPAQVSTATCACGHEPDAHEHYRPGSDCALCGLDACTSYRPQGGTARRLLRRLGLKG
ncbi:MAG: hypothetical protein OJJ54_03860 [Pseudonocardia sp.]|nr:hypothetical protein [Pseudonocardia sp.]